MNGPDLRVFNFPRFGESRPRYSTMGRARRSVELLAALRRAVVRRRWLLAVELFELFGGAVAGLALSYWWLYRALGKFPG